MEVSLPQGCLKAVKKESCKRVTVCVKVGMPIRDGESVCQCSRKGHARHTFNCNRGTFVDSSLAKDSANESNRLDYTTTYNGHEMADRIRCLLGIQQSPGTVALHPMAELKRPNPYLFYAASLSRMNYMIR